ncbi:MAG TPA: hypothetical protein VFA15_03845 [Nitrososphaera sp.]|nr:hypothetical protein [Nitrososphaera sp.]
MVILLAAVNAVAFLLAVVQTYKAFAQTREARQLLETLDVMKTGLAKQLNEHEALLEQANLQVIEQGQRQQDLLLASSSQTEQIQIQLNHLEEIRQALTTRFIGRFTEYFPTVVSIIENAEKEIIVFCDFAAVGCFSCPEDHLRYRQAIEGKLFKGIRTEFTILNKAMRHKVARVEFSKEGNDWDEWKYLNREKIDKFLFYYNLSLTFEALSKETFLDLLEAIEESLLRQSFARANLKEIESEMTIYFWLVDERIAVLAVAPFTDDIGTYGFLTSDHKLLSALKGMSYRYHREDA